MQARVLVMKSLYLSICLALISGCNLLTGGQSSSPDSLNGATLGSQVCPQAPNEPLLSESVQTADLKGGKVDLTGQIRSGQSLGFTFQGKAGQPLNFSTQDNLCIWVFTPSNQLLQGGTLPEDGQYIIQLGTPSGTTTFSLNLDLNEQKETITSSKLDSDDLPVAIPSAIPDSGTGQDPPALPPETINTRVAFERGSTGAFLQESIDPNQTINYLLWCRGGQRMILNVNSSSSGLNIAVISPSGRSLGNFSVDNAYTWRGSLPENGDYKLQVTSSQTIDFILDIEVL
jgi:hypothetical protein